jgi:hypothetical protein
MAIQQWEDGVDLEIHGIGGYRTVRTTEDAALCLLERWPTGKGKAYMVAQRTCLDGLEGRATAENVRQAFIKAAHEAKVHVRSTVDPRKAAIQAASNSPAWRKANRDAMQAVEKSVTKIRAERERFFRDRRNSED